MSKQEIAQAKADEGFTDLHIFHDLRAYYECSEAEADEIIATIKR